jgi:hypothetical protein
MEGTGRSKATFSIPDDTPAIATASYGGTDKFAYGSIGADGKLIRVVVNVTGPYEGTVLFDANSGEHTAAFQIETTGPWKIVVAPLTSAKTWDPSVELKGSGDDVFVVDPPPGGPVSLALDYTGTGTFAFGAIAPGGAKVLANESGAVKRTLTLPAGTQLVSVIAAGPWTVTPS